MNIKIINPNKCFFRMTEILIVVVGYVLIGLLLTLAGIGEEGMSVSSTFQIFLSFI